MRHFKISKFACAALFVLLILYPSRPLSAAEEETATDDNDGKTVLSDGKAVLEESATDVSTDRLGIGKFFKLPFHVSVSVRGGYDDNVVTQTFNRQGSPFVEVGLGITYNFGSPRTQIGLESHFTYTEYFETAAGVNSDINPNLTLNVTHKVTPRLTLALSSLITYQQQPDFSVAASPNRRSGNYFYTSDKLSAAFLWFPRFSTVTSYTFLAISYDQNAIGSFEDRTEHTFGNEFRFLLWPTTNLVAEYRYGIVAYDTLAVFSRDSTTHYFLGGFDHSFSPRISISTRAGVELRSQDNVDDRTDPYAEGALNYAVGPHLSLTLTGRYSIEEPEVANSPSRTTFRTGLTGRYQITPRISTALAFYWEHDEYDGRRVFFFIIPGFAEDAFNLSLSARYAINRNWGIDVGYDFTEVVSDVPLREYYRHRFYGGVGFQF